MPGKARGLGVCGARVAERKFENFCRFCRVSSAWFENFAGRLRGIADDM